MKKQATPCDQRAWPPTSFQTKAETRYIVISLSSLDLEVDFCCLPCSKFRWMSFSCMTTQLYFYNLNLLDIMEEVEWGYWTMLCLAYCGKATPPPTTSYPLLALRASPVDHSNFDIFREMRDYNFWVYSALYPVPHFLFCPLSNFPI